VNIDDAKRHVMNRKWTMLLKKGNDGALDVVMYSDYTNHHDAQYLRSFKTVMAQKQGVSMGAASLTLIGEADGFKRFNIRGDKAIADLLTHTSAHVGTLEVFIGNNIADSEIGDLMGKLHVTDIAKEKVIIPQHQDIDWPAREKAVEAAAMRAFAQEQQGRPNPNDIPSTKPGGGLNPRRWENRQRGNKDDKNNQGLLF
jgi:hypothetical protein